VAYGVAVGKAVLLKQSDIEVPEKTSSLSVELEMSDF
jgi:phosphoenolpyruvate-protein kinase (PTS system EI component)